MLQWVWIVKIDILLMIFIPLEVFMKASWNKDLFHAESTFILNILEEHLALQLTNAKSKGLDENL